MAATKVHKYNMGIVGNCAYLAYIDTRTNVRWMCMPRFDSSFLFGSLLDEEKGGEFSILPVDTQFESAQYYKENTNILCTEITGNGYKYRVTDFAPRFRQYDRNFFPLMLVRIIEPLQGKPMITVKCEPVAEYGKQRPEVVNGSNHIRFLHLGSQVRLTTDVSISYIMNPKPFVLNEKKYLIFTYGVPLEAPIVTTAEEFLEKTTKYWEQWVKSTSVPYFYQRSIIRSALVLKLHQFEDTGGIIAAGTASLPEYDKSTRNWDYRYCWLRDTFYTLTAFNHFGHFEELEKYFHYIQNIVQNETGRFQPLYSVTGQKQLTELILDLNGYLGNKPVRIGNDAYTHIQNDIYGQVLVSFLPLFIDSRLKIKNPSHYLPMVYTLLKQIDERLHEEDAGIWEFRNAKFLHCYTTLFHWVGSKAAYHIAVEMNDEKLKEMASLLINKSAAQIEACYDNNQKAYTLGVGVPNLDASTLALITMNYLPHNSERARLHLEALERELRAENGLFYRYRYADDFGLPHTTFMICAFWYVEALACLGRLDDAVKTFDNLLNYSNHLDLFSEDAGIDGSQWGNFPQTYSHVGLINAAFRIAKRLDNPLFH